MKEFDLFVKRLERGVKVGDTVESLCAELGLDGRKIEKDVVQILGTDAHKLLECYKFDIPLPFL